MQLAADEENLWITIGQFIQQPNLAKQVTVSQVGEAITGVINNVIKEKEAIGTLDISIAIRDRIMQLPHIRDNYSTFIPQITAIINAAKEFAANRIKTNEYERQLTKQIDQFIQQSNLAEQLAITQVEKEIIAIIEKAEQQEIASVDAKPLRHRYEAVAQRAEREVDKLIKGRTGWDPYVYGFLYP